MGALKAKRFPLEVPRGVTVLGELGSWVYNHPRTQDLIGVRYRGGRLLCCSADGREMYFLRPIVDAGPVRRDALALHADKLEMYERFMHRRADKYFNAFVPPFRRPRYLGELALVRYFADKGAGPAAGRETEYEHYFDEPGVAPVYARIYGVGFGQYVVPRGAWRVAEAGIEFYR